MKTLAIVLGLLLLALQYRLWVGDGSLAEVWRLKQALVAQSEENARLRERNEALSAEVEDLKTGLAAIEERARSELGLIKKGETFYQVVEPASSSSTKENP